MLKQEIYLNTVHYPNLRSFMKRHGLTIRDIAQVIHKSYPTTHQKINQKSTPYGKIALFDIEEAHAIISFVISTEQNYLKSKFGDGWETEWRARWGHIEDWFMFIFFDEVVTNVTTLEQNSAKTREAEKQGAHKNHVLSLV